MIAAAGLVYLIVSRGDTPARVQRDAVRVRVKPAFYAWDPINGVVVKNDSLVSSNSLIEHN